MKANCFFSSLNVIDLDIIFCWSQRMNVLHLVFDEKESEDEGGGER